MYSLRNIGLALALMLFSSATLSAQDTAPPTGPQEGIAIHGDWVIEVIRDGEVVSRNEFSNDLLPQGREKLANLLLGSQSVGTWSVQFNPGLGPDSYCLGAAAAGLPGCLIIQEGQIEGPEINLQVTQPTPGVVELSGTTDVLLDFTITEVATGFQQCGSDVTPAACLLVGIGNFTGTTLASPEPVVDGDRIQVTVVISFS